MPLYALVAMCTVGDVYPAPFATTGYHLAGVEVPVPSGDRKVIVDAVLFCADRNFILAGEGKAGENVEIDQAQRYRDLEADSVVLASSVTIHKPGDRWIQTVYVCLADHVERVLLGLGGAGLACPVLAVSGERIEHHGAPFDDQQLAEAFAEPVPVPGPPPRLIPVDDQSPDDAFDALVMPALVATLSHARDHVSVPALAEQALTHLPIFGKSARNRLIGKVDGAARRAANRDPATFEYLPRTATRDHGVVRFVRSPEDAARQGRTQVYQSIARAAGKPTRRRGQPDPDQMALFDDLIDELQQVDEGPDDELSDEEEGE